MHDGIRIVRNGPIFEITIDRPKANAIDLKASLALNEAIETFRDDADMRVGIITGAGERFFSPGWDLKAAAAGEASDAGRYTSNRVPFSGADSTCTKP